MYDKLKAVYLLFEKGSDHFHKIFAKAQCPPIDQDKIKTFMITEGHVTEWELYGRDLMYDLTEAGKRFSLKLQKFHSLDLILADLDKRKNINTPTFQQICESVSVQYDESLYEYLLDDGLVKEIVSRDLDKSVRINDDGSKWLRQGGYVSWIDGRVNTVYREQNKSVTHMEPEHLHERILYFLEQKSKKEFGEYQWLSDEFPDVQYKALNLIAQQLKAKQQIEVKASGPLAYSFGKDRRRNSEWEDERNPPQPPPLPMKVYAFITLVGIDEVKRLKHNQPSLALAPVQNTYYDHSQHVDQSVKVQADKVDTVATNVDTVKVVNNPKEKPRDWTKEIIFSIAASVIAGLVLWYVFHVG